MTTSVSGLVSGLDTTSIIQQLIALESLPIQTLQGRVRVRTGEQTELKALTARILSLKLDAGTLARNATFEAKKVASSSETVLTAAVDTSAAEGSYTFTVGKLARTSQILSKGFAAKNTAIGKGNLTIEIGNGFVDRKTQVDALNGGRGIDRGTFKLTDGEGNAATIDVSAAATVQDILDAVNTGATKITASLSSDGLVLTDASAAPSITVAEVNGKTTAADLGLTGQSTLNGRITGSRINLLEGTTRLDSLNDGNGVRTTYDGGTGASANDLQFTTRDGSTFNVDLNAASSSSPTTVQDVLNAINNASGNAGRVVASVSTDQQSLTLSDTTAGAGVLAVAALNSSNALQDLGFRSVTAENAATGLEDAVNGNRIVGKRILSGLNSVLTATLNGGKRQFPASDTQGVADGSVLLTDRAGTATTVNLSSRVATTNSVAALAADTSLTLTSAAGFAAGNLLRITNGASTVVRRVTSVNYTTNVVSFDQQLGTAFGIGSGVYASNESLSDVRNSIAGRTSNVLTTQFNAERNGLKIVDASGGTGLLRIQESGSTVAADLGIKTADVSGLNPDAVGTTTTFVDAALNSFGDSLIGLQVEVTAGANAGYSGKILDFDASTNTVTLDTAATAAFSAADTFRITGVNASSYNGRDTDPAYLTERTLLSSLNGGAGVYAGSIRITDRQGRVFTSDLSTETRIGEVINDINGASAAAGSTLTASINASGDGILLTHAAGTGSIRVEEVSGGTTAKDLNLLGSSSTSTLDGTFEYSVTIGASDTLETVRDAINALKIPVAATIVQDGSATPYRLNLTSQRSGLAGKLVVDAQRLNLSFQTVSEGEDAALLFGSGGGGGSPVLFTSSDNTIDNVVPGMTLTLKSTSATPVTASVTRDRDFIAKQVGDFVANFNAIIDKIKEDTQFIPDATGATQGQRGVLLGNQSVTNLQSELFRSVLKQVPQLSATLNGLDNVGVRLNTAGKLAFDETKFLDKMDADFKGVKKLFISGADITGNTSLSALRKGKGVRTAGGGVQDFQIRMRSGTMLKIALSSSSDDSAVGSVQAVLSAINNATGNGGLLVASVSSDGSGITLVDSSVGTQATTVTSLNGSHAAEDLGLQKSAAYVAASSSTTLKGNAINLGGIANLIEQRLDFVASDEHGTLPGASNILDVQIKDMNKSIERLQARLDQKRKRLEAQFTKLETTLSQLQATSSFLGSQLQQAVSNSKSSAKK